MTREPAWTHTDLHTRTSSSLREHQQPSWFPLSLVSGSDSAGISAVRPLTSPRRFLVHPRLSIKHYAHMARTAHSSSPPHLSATAYSLREARPPRGDFDSSSPGPGVRQGVIADQGPPVPRAACDASSKKRSQTQGVRRDAAWRQRQIPWPIFCRCSARSRG